MGLFLFLLLAFAVIFVAIRFPGVQTKVAQRVAAYLSEKIDHEVTIGRVDIAFFSNVVLEQVKVQDYREEELFYVGRLEADIDAFSIFDPNTLSINTLELQQPRANLVMYEGTDTLNLSSFFNALGDLFVKDTTKPSEPFNFNLNELIIRNGRFTYDDFNDPRSEYGIDYSHMTIDRLSGRFNEIQLDDTIKVNVMDLSAVETRSNTRLHNLDTRMTYASTFWEWDALDLQVNKSNLQNYVRFDYNRFGNFRDFIDSVTMTVNLQDARVYSRDIATFAPPLQEYNESLLAHSIEFKGTVSNFTASNVDLEYGEHTRIIGNVKADGLPNFEETFANLRLQNSTINASDLRQFLPQEAYQVVARLGTVTLEGRFLGFYNDFVANGTFATALGRLQSDINLKIDDDRRTSSYSGFVTTNGFNLGRLLNAEEYIRTISMSGRVEGSGFTLEDARVNLDATIRQVQLLDYNYQNIKADGVLSRQKFVGEVAVNDPNLVFTADGEVDLAKDRQAFNMVADLEKVDLQALNFSEVPFTVRTAANLNFQGLSLDAFAGTARLDSAYVFYKGNELTLDSLIVDSEIAAGQRSLKLDSDLLALQVSGNFDYTTLIDDLKNLVEEYKLNFESNDAATAAYYRRKSAALGEEYALNYTVDLRHPNPVLQLLVPELTISDFSRAEGSFRHGTTVILELYADVDTINYQDYQLFGNNIELNTSKLQQSPDVLAAALFTSERQLLPNEEQTQDFFVEGIWSERTINFSTSVRQPEHNNRALVTGDLNFLQDQIQIVFDQSNITLQQNQWAFNPGNTVYISAGGDKIVFENFALTNQNQVIRAEGVVSNEPDSRLTVDVENFDLRNLNPLIAMDIAGTLTGHVVARDVLELADLNASMRVDSFYLENVYIGNVVGQTNWLNAQKQAVIDVGIERDNRKVLSVTGNYNPQAQEDQLDLLAVMDQANLKLVEPVLKPIMSDLEGGMEGRVRILGSLSYPVLKGSVMVNNGQFTFDYLNTTYRFSDRIYLGPNSISFRNAQLRDLYGNRATVTGGIAHDGFQDMVLDIAARYSNFMVLNTTEAQNELFYGTAFATGTASVLGPVENLQVNVDARSEENTRIVLPLDYQTDVARKDFIRFVNRNLGDTTAIAVEAEEQRVDLSGINLDFDLDVTDDAYFEIIIDRTTGDVIRGSGNGDIRMTIDTRGEFNMYGTFEITQGAYNLNLLEGLVTREFEVVPGGTITWNGDPVDGMMDLKATYTQMASLGDYYGNSESVALQGRYPVTAEIDLTGPLLTPQIQLGLNVEQAPQVSEEARSLIRSINNDESELNRQVFSLLVLQRLSPSGSLAFGGGNLGGGAVGGSLGSLLSSQLNNFFNSIDSNLQIDIGLGGINQEALATLQLRLSYTFFQGRLRVTNETGFGGVSDRVGGNETYVGNWFLDYYITQSGELRARLEYSTTPDIYINRITTRQSISILHTKRFDNFQELFGSERRQRRQQQRELERERIILDSDPRLEL
ncbi:MAG: translocation/assembly module TamB domain-containing protein [Hymenobacteraceae bacterium]|nr:translocation/assembly module TamB domain-containing protein [Hymenobacteraceae bacterium]